MSSVNKILFLIPCILFLMVSSADGLKCYECNDCNRERSDIEECNSSQNVCMKLVLGELVSKRCSREELCSLKALEDGLNDAWNRFKEIFTDENANRNTGKNAVNCCNSDYCNAASLPQKTFNFFGAILTTTVTLMYHLH